MNKKRIYHACEHIYQGHNSLSEKDFAKAILDLIAEDQAKGYEVEVQYSTTNVGNQVVFSALILAYTEE